MLTFFPIPYPDEILYSTFARYHMRSANSSIKDTLDDLFGKKTVISTIDLPSHLYSLCNRIPSSNSSITPEKILEKHTLYPFYSPFLPVSRAQQLKEMMIGDNGQSIHMMTGVISGAICTKHSLYYCPSCFTEDLKQYGEPYFHRIHQVPGVFVCPKHNAWLHPFKEKDSFNKHEFIALPLTLNNSLKYEEINISQKTRNLLFQIAKDIEFLLEHGIGENLYEAKIMYLSQLTKQGFVTVGKRIKQKFLHEQFQLFYGHELLSLLECSIEGRYNWLTFIVRKAKKTIHPLRHVLMMRFLFGTVRDFKLEDTHSNPFGHGPWPCLNKAVAHFGEMIINRVYISRCYNTKRPVGTFCCSCGFIYSRTGPDQSETDAYKIGRIKAFGSQWYEKLKETCQQNISYRAIARALNVDVNTVIKYLKLIEAERLQDQIEKEKNLYVRLQRAETVNEPERITKQRKISSAVRVDWKERDLVLSKLVEQECQRILHNQDEKPVQITPTRIGKILEKEAWFQHYKNKLPLTMEKLNLYKETMEEFQVRRVRWVIKQLKLQNKALRKWEIERLAGLRKNYSPLVYNEIMKGISS
ncbi:TnsD family Tn7-like transposition protein [Bacillus bingmayongensis]|uniref:TnsD family Tn7-like transposition protein n=1 Tax=Bacillus bingmayongensis TaxID=1150157 RepID=UPI001C8EA020|nr:TnsD family Tn7-like transposition protein [Bacillus bingmayongensis]MBY0596492.1 TnsD family transposase [Bacillus bingmayongensis]